MLILNPVSRRNQAGRSPAGFTLIELMVVIAIIGIVASITIPWLMNPERRVKKVARELIGDMQEARMGAVKTGNPWRIVFDIDSQGDENGDGDPWNDSGDSPPDADHLVKPVNFAGHAQGVKYGNGCGGTNIPYGATNTLTFNPRGTCNAGYAYLKYRNASHRVGTLSTGVIKIDRCSGGVWK